MNNITKNLLLGLTFVCVVVLIVFCIQLIVLNRGVEPGTPGTVISGGQQGDEDPGQEGDEEPGGEENPVNTPGTPRPPPQGTRRELMVTMESVLVVYSRDELFDFEEREIDWWFNYKGGGNAKLEISYIVITPQGMAANAESLLNNYTGGTEAQFNGEEAIAGSELIGYHVSAMFGGGMYEAWIYSLLGSDLALVFVINYETEQQKDALYEVLSTLNMISINDAAAQSPTDQPNGSNDDENGDDNEDE